MAYKIGKRVFNDLYVHIAELHLLDTENKKRITDALQKISADYEYRPNVAKLNLRSDRLSLLAYEAFETDPFPPLCASWVFLPGSREINAHRTYVESLNPPILHRKELLVSQTHPKRKSWAQLTLIAEEIGLFEDTTIIGFKRNWDDLIHRKGYSLVSDEFVPLGNEISESSPVQTWVEFETDIQRHRTALNRTDISAPVQLLLRNGLLETSKSFFDYGCGRGGDVATLKANGFNASGWDPYFAPNENVAEADVVNLGFVVNVIEDPEERDDAIKKAFRLTRQVLVVAVMLLGNDRPGRPFKDGYITSRNTFQKYFSQTQFKEYLENVLEQEVYMAGPGVAFVFADKDCEQRFHTHRFRSRSVVSRILAAKPLTRKIDRQSENRKESNVLSLLDKAKPHLDRLWTIALDLGRIPETDEVQSAEEVALICGGWRKAHKMLIQNYDQTLLLKAAATRADDLLLYLATQLFSKRRTYRQLERRLQQDIKSFFGDFRKAQQLATELLNAAGDSNQLLLACRVAATSGLGYLDGQHSLQLHMSMVERLPVLLRAYVACGLMIWDSISEVQIVKIHIGSGKLTLMEFDNFDADPLPALSRRIKVDARKIDYDLFEYGSLEYPKPVLYWKSRYLHEDYPGYTEQLAFDETLECTNIIEGTSFGPSREALVSELKMRRLEISGKKLGRSQNFPALDDNCGKNFTFRSFVECGVTQQRRGLPNVPSNPDSYNALYDLAVKILDPVIEYFGAIELTYGFCSSELSRHIPHRVAPKLDQHAAREKRRDGKYICDRGGAACDFFVQDEDMHEVANWIIDNLPYDRLYFYGADRPVHVSYSENHSKQAFDMILTSGGRLIPRKYNY